MKHFKDVGKNILSNDIDVSDVDSDLKEPYLVSMHVATLHI